MSRGPISIFGPIFKVEDRSEDPDLRIAEGSWRPGEGGAEEDVPEGGFLRECKFKIISGPDSL